MILISFSLALIAIAYGATLLAQSKKENSGGLYKFLAWFVIVMAFLVLLCDGTHAIMRCCPMHQHEMMVEKECRMMGGNQMTCPMEMMHCHQGDMNCCNRMMNGGGNNNCCDGKDGGNANSSCHEGNMNAGSCPMMGNMKCKPDSEKAKK